MSLNALYQNFTDMKFNSGSYMTSTFGTGTDDKENSDSYFAKKGEPTYQKEMDSDNDGLVSYEEFKDYCSTNNVSSKEMKKMLEARSAYQMSKDALNTANNAQKSEEDSTVGNLDLIYAKDGDNKYDAEQDTNGDSKVSYIEYLRYCEQNAKMETKNSDTKIVDYDKSKFMTVSFGHAANAYNKITAKNPEIKFEKNV